MTEFKNLTSSDFMKAVKLPKTTLKVAEVLEFRDKARNELEFSKMRITEIDEEIDERVTMLYDLKSDSTGKLYVVEDVSEAALHVIIKRSMEIGEIEKQCFRWDGQWMVRSIKRIPRYATIAWWDGKWHEGERFIRDK